jgi:hypothetical protein
LFDELNSKSIEDDLLHDSQAAAEQSSHRHESIEGDIN